MQIGNIIKEKRKEIGLTQAELAKKISVSKTLILKYEKNELIPTDDKLKSLSRVLLVDLVSLIGTSNTASVVDQSEANVKKFFNILAFILLGICSILLFIFFIPLYHYPGDKTTFYSSLNLIILGDSSILLIGQFLNLLAISFLITAVFIKQDIIKRILVLLSVPLITLTFIFYLII